MRAVETADLARTVRAMVTDPKRHPASDGAHRLAWYLAEIVGDWPDFLRNAALTTHLLYRLIDGEVEPSDEAAARIEHASGGAVRAGDWQTGGPLRWQDRPFARERAA